MLVFKKYFWQICTMILAFNTALAQENFVVGVGSSLELDENIFGANLRAYYGVNEQLCFGPEVSYFPYQEIDEEYQLSIVDLNVNAHYIFEINHKLGIYPLSGINYTIEKERLIEDKDRSIQIEELGLNYGLGLHYNFGSFYLFGEFKGIIGQLNDHFITIGAIFSLKRFKNKTNHKEVH